MFFLRVLLFFLVCFVLAACENDDSVMDDKGMSSSGDSVQGAPSIQTAEEPNTGSINTVKARILPERPGVSDCLHVVIQGQPGASGIKWMIDNNVVPGAVRGEFCGPFERNDVVTVVVGTEDQGASASINIVNSLPRVVDISSTPDAIFAGVDVSVVPIAEDADGDEVSFSYQWLVNGEADPLWVEPTLSGNSFTKGDTLKVLITPNDFYDDGPVYESDTTTVPNAQPVIVSKPPETITSLDYRYQVEVSDPDDSQFTYRLDEAPDGMEIDPASGLIRWSLKGVEAGTYAITIIATDPEGAEGVQGYSLSLGF